MNCAKEWIVRLYIAIHMVTYIYIRLYGYIYKKFYNKKKQNKTKQHSVYLWGVDTMIYRESS